MRQARLYDGGKQVEKREKAKATSQKLAFNRNSAKVLLK